MPKIPALTRDVPQTVDIAIPQGREKEAQTRLQYLIKKAGLKEVDALKQLKWEMEPENRVQKGGSSMPEYRPIPGQTNAWPSAYLPTDDLTQRAKEKASDLLGPYRPIVPSPLPAKTGAANPAPANAVNPTPAVSAAGVGGISMEDRLYQSIHPDTFAKVLETIMQFVTGKPISRQAGGEVEPDKEYLVGEEGPERFKPAVPGMILPYKTTPTPLGPVQSGITYGGSVDLTNPNRLSTPSEYWEKSKRSLANPGEWLKNQFLPPRINLPFGMGELTRKETPGFEFENNLSAGAPEGGFIAPPYTGPGPWRNAPGGEKAVEMKPNEEGTWQEYAPGIRYKLGPENIAGDQAARERILAEAGRATEKYGIPIPQRGYYDAHPEERFMDMAAESNKELMDMFKKAKTPATRAAIGRLIETQSANQQKYYQAGLEFGPGSPASQEKLAHAEYLRNIPEAHLTGIQEQTRSHLEGINRQVAGHLEAAKITAEDPIMKEIGAILTQGQKMSEMYGTPFDPQKTVGNVLKVYKALGAISEEQWAKIPSEYKEKIWTEQSLRADLKASGMKDKEIEKYIKRAKAAGKI